MFSVFKNIRLKQLLIDVQLQLFDSVVLPVLIYAKYRELKILTIIEKIHLQFLKYSTPLCMIYGELGRLSIEREIKKKIQFWLRLADANKNKLGSKIYHVSLNMHLANIYSFPWICAIENI